MLSLEYLEDKVYTNNIVKMYQKLNTELVKKIITKLEKTGDISSYTKQQVLNLSRRGGREIFINSLKETKHLSKERKKELIDLFTEITKDNLESYRELYNQADVKFEISKSQLQILNTMVKMTDRELENFTRTIAFNTRQDFVNAVDKMYMEVSTGLTDFQKAFRKTTNKLAAKGVTLTMSNGKNRSIESAVRQNVSYAIRQSVREINDDVGEKLGCDGVQINITPNCRHEHIPINGQKFRVDSREWKRYQSLLEDYNCQHYATPIFYDIEDNIYSKKEIQRANTRTVTVDDKTMSYYDATQKQRSLERSVRNAKKIYMSEPTKENKLNVMLAQKKVRNFCTKAGLERQYDREYYAGYNN